ncbi:MAG: hypothetical protein IJP80_03915 [Bacteroidales bacterium]|nr:hypothetical protein [Bacteroidales bacterium]
MILNSKIINALKEKSGLEFDKANDFSILSSNIFTMTGRTIGVTTLKRLFNYINDSRNASNYTLNTIAQYLGYREWDEYMRTISTDSEWHFHDETIYIDQLAVGDNVTIHYLDRTVSFNVEKRPYHNVLVVTSASNSSLRKNDILFVHSIRKGSILTAEKIVRDDIEGNYRTRGEIGSIVIKRDNH